MKLTPYKDLLAYAVQHKITIGAFNSFNLESLQAVVSAANKMDCPLIVQTYHEHFKYAGADYMAAIANVAAKNSKVRLAKEVYHRNFRKKKLERGGQATGLVLLSMLSVGIYCFNDKAFSS